MSLTMALNTYALTNSYILITYDNGVLPNQLDNVTCKGLSGLTMTTGTCVK